MMNKTRRTLCQSMGGLFGLIGLGACSQPQPLHPAPVYTEEEKQRMYKFRGVEGYELYVSGFGRTSEDGVFARLKDAQGNRIEGGYFWERGDSKSAGSISPPFFLKSITVEVATHSNGKMLYQSSIPVADRIPDELLDELRRDPKGSLRIKIRLHREGVLLGWDIERRLNPWGYTMAEINKDNIHIPAAYSHTGGDFKEARPAHYLWEGNGLQGLPEDIPVWNKNLPKKTPFWRWQKFVHFPSTMALPLNAADQVLLDKNNLKTVTGTIITNPPTPSNHRRIWEKGWYIHPRTKQRIETDF